MSRIKTKRTLRRLNAGPAAAYTVAWLVVFVCIAQSRSSGLEEGKPTPPAEKLPNAEAILDSYVEAIGGASAIKRIYNRVTKGTIEIKSFGLKGTMASYGAAPDKTYSRIELGPLGATEEGAIGSVVWRMHPMMGNKLLKGDERAMVLSHARFYGELDWRTAYRRAEYTGIAEVEGKPAYKVAMTPHQGPVETRFYDKQSRLQVKSMFTIDGPTGSMPIETSISDYRNIDGVLIAHRMVQKIAGQEIVITLDSVKHNVELPPDRFDAPPAIKELMAKAADADTDADAAEKSDK